MTTLRVPHGSSIPAGFKPAREPLQVASLRITCLLSAKDTGGQYSLFEIVTPPHDPGPPPHTHTLEDETFYVLEGEHTVVVDGVETRGGPGAWMFAPRHKPHAFRNDGDTPCRVLMIASPGGFENFFAACGEPAGPVGSWKGPPTQAQIDKILEQMPVYGMTAHV